MMISTAAANTFPGKFPASDSSQISRLKQMSDEEQKIVIEFLNNHLLQDPVSTIEDLHCQLHDGVLLCRLINMIQPGLVKNIGQKDLSFVKMDNIVKFLHGARQLGIQDAALFDAVDLFEGKNMIAVLHTVANLATLLLGHEILPQKTAAHSLRLCYSSDESSNNEDDDQGSKRESPVDLGTDVLSTPTFGNSMTTQECASQFLGDSKFDQGEGAGYRYRDVREIFDQKPPVETEEYNYQSLMESYQYPPRPRQRQPSAGSIDRPPKSPLRRSGCHALYVGRKSRSIVCHDSNLLPPSHFNAGRRPSAPTISLRQREQDMDILYTTSMSRSNSMDDESITAPTIEEFDETLSSIHTASVNSIKHGSFGRKLNARLLAEVADGDENAACREQLFLKNTDGTPSSQFQLGNCIGKGQFGSVYRALDLATGEIVAVKRIKIENDQEIDKDIMKEVSLLKTLSHKNVISYLGFVRSKNHINIVLEYAENGSLMSTLKAFGAFPEKLVASFCIKILDGLEYLHSNSVVHCDLKAANILTTKTGDVKLSDFGVSLNMKLKDNATEEDDSISGTPNWMAPEVIELKGTSTSSDIWSLGCTLVELVTGKPPYADLIPMSAMFRIVEDDYPPLPANISENMRDFLLCCFQKDPSKRPSATELKLHPWIQQHDKGCRSEAPSARQYLATATTYQALAQMPVPTENEKNLQYPRIYYNIMPDGNSLQSSSSHSGSSTVKEESTREGNANDRYGNGGQGLHCFTLTCFGSQPIECKVCRDIMYGSGILCTVCSLVCHEDCRSSAFSCPPKVRNIQPSYDAVFSAKIYNHQRRKASLTPSLEPDFARMARLSDLENHPQADSIRKYAQALGLSAHETRALSENPALLSHTIALQESKSTLPVNKTRAHATAKHRKASHDEQCIIS